MVERSGFELARRAQENRWQSSAPAVGAAARGGVD